MKSKDRAKIVSVAASLHGKDWIVCKADLLLPSDRWFLARLETGGSNWDTTLFRCDLVVQPLYTPAMLHSVGYTIPIESWSRWSLREFDHAAIGASLQEELEQTWRNLHRLAQVCSFVSYAPCFAKEQGMLDRGPDPRIERDLAGACAILGRLEESLNHCATAKRVLSSMPVIEGVEGPKLTLDYLNHLENAVRAGQRAIYEMFEPIRLDSMRRLGVEKVTMMTEGAGDWEPSTTIGRRGSPGSHDEGSEP